MELFLGEHGEVLRSAIMGSFVLVMLFMALNLISDIMPAYNTKVSASSMGMYDEIKNNSPSIISENVIYVNYKQEAVLSQYISAKDFDGSDITEKIIYEGTVDTSKKGLNIINAKVTNDKGYVAEKRIYILVE